MDKKYQVFISSTYTDLIEERQAVIEAVLNAEHIPAGMEAFKVSGKSQEEIIRRWIEESDIYVLILGPRYGSKNQDGISYTQWEYNLAKELNKPMFSIFLTDEYINGMVAQGRINATSLETQLPDYKTFKEEVSSTLVHMINNIESIKLGVADSIRQIQRDEDDNLEGWIKGHHLTELDALRKENKELLEKLTNRQDEVIDMQKELRDVKDNFIGHYSFDFLFDLLENKAISNNMKSYFIENYESHGIDLDDGDLTYWREKFDLRASVNDWLEFISPALLMEKVDIYDMNYATGHNDWLLKLLVQYDIIKIESRKNSHGKAIGKLILTEVGRKYISMLAMQLK